MAPVTVPRDYQYRNMDAAKRMSDAISLHQTVLTMDELLAGRYAAISIADGSSDGVAYESREQAALYQRHNAARCGYFRIPPGDRWPPELCDVLLWYVRSAYDNGVRQDPAQSLFIPQNLEQVIEHIENTYGERL